MKSESIATKTSTMILFILIAFITPLLFPYEDGQRACPASAPDPCQQLPTVRVGEGLENRVEITVHFTSKVYATERLHVRESQRLARHSLRIARSS